MWWAISRVIAVLAGLAATALQLAQVFTAPAVGGDFVPLRHAAQALLSGTSIFADPLFVYPPSAAIPLLFTAVGTIAFAWDLWAVLSILGLCGSAWLIASQADPKRRVVIGGASTFALVIGCAANDSLYLGNLSILLVPIAVGALIAFGHGRWLFGCVLVCASLLVKPLLVPLLVVPLVFGHRRELMTAAGPTALMVALSMALVPGGGHFPHVLAFDLSGSNLHGRAAVFNLSIAGWLEAHSVGRDTSTALRVTCAIAVLAMIALVLKRMDRREANLAAITQTGNVAMLGVLLVGSLSEVHFLVVVLAASILQVAVQPTSRVAWLVPGMALIAVPAPYRAMVIGSSATQSWYLCAEIALLLGNVAVSYVQPAYDSAHDADPDADVNPVSSSATGVAARAG